MRAMIVDDSKAMRAIIGRIVKGLGFEVSEAADGQAALEKFTLDGPCELALIDWNMPQMNGYELLQTLRADPRYNNMRIVMITTESAIAQIQEALKGGANEYLIKPFTAEDLVAKLAMIGLALPA